MKVYLELPSNSRGLKRVYDALIKYKPPEVEVTHDSTKADLTILHINGRKEHFEKKIESLKRDRRPYAMIQYVLRSTMNPHTRDWLEMWIGAKCVWSYYDLPELVRQDMIPTAQRFSFHGFYYAPLGVEPGVFKDSHKHPRQYVCAVNSQSYLTESAREIIIAAERLNRRVFYLGNLNRKRKNVLSAIDISDFQLAEMYSRCEYVSGLRRLEGFEQPVIEGLLCGARPIVFDRPEMRKWYDGLAIFIPELPREETIDYLEGVFRTPGNDVTEAEKALALNRFDWSIIIKGFWEKVL